MSCMSGSPNLNRFRDRGQVAVQLVSCGVLLPGLVEDCTQQLSSLYPKMKLDINKNAFYCVCYSVQSVNSFMRHLIMKG